MSTKDIFFVGLLISTVSISVRTKGSEHFEAEVKRAHDSDSDDESFSIPLPHHRSIIIQKTLDELDVYVDEPLKVIIRELTFGFDEVTIKDLVTDMVKESGGDSIDQKICFEKLKNAICTYDSERKEQKLQRLKQLIVEYFSSVQNDDLPRIVVRPKIVRKKNRVRQYPLFDDVYHPDKEIFIEAAEQLKEGRLNEEFPKGILLYGPPGVGKNEMIKALVNESSCQIFTVKASRVVGGHQGSGAQAIESIFDQARMIESNKGVIVLVDELQGLTPVTSDKNVGHAFKNSGIDHENALTQLWLEYDRCLEESDNILIVATCNQFDRIDERIRGRFECIEFSQLDKSGTIEILKIKFKHFGISFSESELEEHAEGMKNLNGRDLNKIIANAKIYIGRGKSKEEAIEQAIKDLKKNTDKAELMAKNRKFEKFKNNISTGIGQGMGTAIGGGIIAGAAALCMLGIKLVLGNRTSNSAA